MPTEAARQRLREIASGAIDAALRCGRAEPGYHQYIGPAELRAELAAPGASFVTLLRDDRLRGCIGSLQAQRPLAEDVAHNAVAAALSDPRFAPLQPAEFPDVAIHISVLGEPQPLDCSSEAALIAALRPGVDGLILREGEGPGAAQATYLPSVWLQLPDPRDFVRQLKLKAGLPEQYWSERMRAASYRVDAF